MKLFESGKKLNWIAFVSNRFARVDKKGRASVTSKLATLGICLGVMTLIVVLSIMNGFQMSFIDSILEISSYHIQAQSSDSEYSKDLCENWKDLNIVDSVTPFMEAQTLITSEYGRESAAVIRAVDAESCRKDSGFIKELKLRHGEFDFTKENTIILGSSLARILGVHVGDVINLFVLSGSDDVSLFSADRNFEVTGIFTSGYSEINSSYCFISLEDGKKYFGEDAKLTYGIKLKDSENDNWAISFLEKTNPDYKYKSWRDYNKSFFGTLRIEKNMLMLMVALIFVVVGINIFNGMRRLVFERKSEIAIFSALGASNAKIKSIFILRGLYSGLVGSLLGVVLGLLISINSPFVFNSVSKILFFFQYIFTSIVSPENLPFLRENSTYALYASIPARVFYSEVVFVFLFGLASPLIASWIAAKNVLKMTIAEVLHHE